MIDGTIGKIALLNQKMYFYVCIYLFSIEKKASGTTTKKEKVKGTPADLDKNQMEDHVHKYHPNSITGPPSRSRPILNNENREATPIAAVRTRPNLGALSKERVALGEYWKLLIGFSATPSRKIDYDGSVED